MTFYSVSATGVGTLSYQLFANNIAIAGAPNSILTLPTWLDKGRNRARNMATMGWFVCCALEKGVTNPEERSV